MNITRKLATFLSIFVALLFIVGSVSAQEQQVNVYFFWGVGCPHCEQEKEFLAELEEKYGEVMVHDFEVWKDSENRELLKEVGRELGVNVSGVPFTVVGESHFTGWMSVDTTGADIEDAVQCALEDGCRDRVGEILAEKYPEQEDGCDCSGENDETCDCSAEQREKCGCGEVKGTKIPEELDLPFIGKIETKEFSLPVLTIILGGLDGFNPCAMWVLVFLIGLLLGLKDKRRRWVLGIAFIAASAFVYFLFMAAWLNLLLFVGFLVWVRALIGLVALGGGIYNLREYVVNKEGACKVTGGQRRQAIFEKLKKVTHKKQFLLALGGIVLLAFAVNLVELVCSAGLPALFTQILALSNLPRWQYYAYMLLYIFVFMLDDLIIFFTAMKTLEVTGLGTKYTRFSNLIGGILMSILGLLLIFKPELLMFG